MVADLVMLDLETASRNESMETTNLLQWMASAGARPSGSSQTAPGPDSRRSYVSPKLLCRQFPGAGRGLAALEPISPNEEIIRVPHSHLLNSHTIIKHIAQYNDDIRLGSLYGNVVVEGDKKPDDITAIYSQMSYEEMSNMSSFQLMGMYICLERARGEASFWKPLLDLMPGLEAFEYCPLVWEVMEVEGWREYLGMLPRVVRKHAEGVGERFWGDYEVVRLVVSAKAGPAGSGLGTSGPGPGTNGTSAGPGLGTESKAGTIGANALGLVPFLLAWLSINSRCLYMELPESKDTSDNFTMAPYVDYINHTDTDHCQIKIDSKGFHVTTTTSYVPGDQLFLSYGAHSNGFLLCEYGFCLDKNKWNDIDVSELILKQALEEQMQFLEHQGYYDDYTISESGGVSYRTEIALAVLQELVPSESRKLNAFILGVSAGEVYAKGSRAVLGGILRELREECEERMGVGKEGVWGVIGGLYGDMKGIIDRLDW